MRKPHEGSKKLSSELIDVLKASAEDETLSSKALAERFGVTPSAIAQRKSNLRKSGLLDGEAVNFQALIPHAVVTMLFKLELGSHQNEQDAVDYFADLEYVILVKKLSGDDFDIWVDFVVFDKDFVPQGASLEIGIVEKSQKLRDVPVKVIKSRRFVSEQIKFQSKSKHLGILLSEMGLL